MYTSSIISLILTILVIYLFCKHKHIRTCVASLILHKIKEVEATLKIVRPIPPQRTVTYRKYKNLDRNQFRQDLIEGYSEKSPSMMDDMVQQYNDMIIIALDKQILEKLS